MNTRVDTSFGPFLLGWSDAGLLRVRWQDKTEDALPLSNAPAWVRTSAEQLRQHLAGDFQNFKDVPLDPSAVTAFQWRVLSAARDVGPGSVETYGDLAKRIGQPSAARAVGGALGANPWMIVVPCHRFVGANRSLTGFSAPGGVETKRRLLTLEGCAVAVDNAEPCLLS
ncbi:methylated-DNA--[protein]-cysteine S-methyltransferase [Nibricoccus sp. IMCC34717]|uniref:methylated-DNA--[protein]-cysteine S-methyltransferase n=1 Tax=Nibricoccus sp. IMCC34717 TaxID=3034021 RepID=UPI00384FBFB3